MEQPRLPGLVPLAAGLLGASLGLLGGAALKVRRPRLGEGGG